MNADMALTLAGLTLEVVLFAVLLARRVQRTLSTFLCFIGVALATDALASLVPGILPRPIYLDFWIASLVLEFLSLAGLTLELGRNVRKQNRAAPSNWALAMVMYVPVAGVLTLLSSWYIPPNLPLVWQIEMRTSQATAVLGLGAFLTLVWWSALRRLRWPAREFRVAVGIGIEALAGLVAVIVHSHQSVGPSYHWVDVSASVVYLCVLIYWVQFFVFEDDAAAETAQQTAEFAAAGRSEVRDGARRMSVDRISARP
jgi:low temperature requirement protein LtrA